MTTSVIEVRSMRWWDIDVVDALEQALFPQDPWSIDQWWRELAQLHNYYFVVESAGELCGYAGLSISGSDADLQTIGISDSFQRQGIGRKLLDQLVDLSRDLGVTYIFLEVRSDNTSALSMYSSFGFVEISKRARYYPDGTDAVILRRDDRERSP
ncbi:MAG: ribosomal protein S18-alanine N-acetyltransferase [Candidatus Nanopelagicales bacterium]|nr:ribosomal protein S18-alanine N-acetyltransferase [Candidatus Nanopelagicales bacterium]